MSILILVLVVLALATTQMLAGGRQLFLCLPGYGLIALAAVLSWAPQRRSPVPRAAVECLVVAVILCGYISIRALFSPEAFLARNDLYAAFSAGALYLLVALNLATSRLRLFLVVAILTLALANCGIGAVQYFKGQNFMPFPFLPRPDYDTRASGFYGYPNHLSGFLEMALMLGLSLTFWSRWPVWAKILVGYVCGMCLLCILITGSRGGYISSAVGLLVFVTLSLVSIGKLAPGRILVLMIAGLIFIGGAAWGARQVMAKSFLVSSRAEQTLTVDASRMQLWQAALKQFRLQPAVGTGSGTYLYYGRQFRHPASNKDPIHAHNDYLELLAEYGLIGLICAVVFLETHLRSGWNAFRQRLSPADGLEGQVSNSLALTIGAISAAAACLVHSMLDFNLHMPANLLTAALIFGLLATPGERPAVSASEREPGGSPLLRLALPSLGILMAALIGPTAPAEYYAQRTRAILSNWRRSISPEPNHEMEALARRGLEWNPRDPGLHFSIAEAQSALGSLETDIQAKEAFYLRASESYRKALECAPGDVILLLAWAASLDALQRFPESAPLYARAVQLDPRGGATHNFFARHLYLQGKYPEAAAEFQLGMRYGAWHSAKAGLDEIEAELKDRADKPIPPN